jgi:hypothetical protein
MDATVVSYVTELSNGEADTTNVLPGIYEDVLGQINIPPILVTTQALSPNGDYSVSLPEGSISGLFYFISNTGFHYYQQLGELSVREADWLLPTWRNISSPQNGQTVYSFVRESRNQRDIFPVPASSANIYALFTYVPSVANNLPSYAPTDTLPAWLQMPVALLCLGEEYARESNHQNMAMSKACTMLGQLMLKAVLK